VVEIDTVLLKVASRCNLDCSYCYVYQMGDNGWANMPKRMSDETIEDVANALSAYVSRTKRPFAVVLHGGEPLLLGALGLNKVLSALRRILTNDYPISIQSNGVLISEAILDICSEYRTSLSVSIDGPKRLHDRNRVGHSGGGSFDDVMAGIDVLRNHPDCRFLFAGVLAVIDPASEPEEVYSFLKELQAPSIDFLYRDGNHSRLPSGKVSFYSTEYGTWLSRLLEIYVADRNPPRVRVLDDMIKLALGGSGTKEGTGLTDFGILVIDSDGSITKNDTLKSSYDGADRFEHGWSIHSHRLEDVLGSKEFAAYHGAQRPSSELCRTCPDLEICGGGMTLHRWSDESGYNNPSVYCTDQRLVISTIRRYLTVLQE
jgi:uncharacterized protein